MSWGKVKVPSVPSLPRHPVKGESDGSTNTTSANIDIVKAYSPALHSQRTTKIHKFKSGPDSFIGSGP